MKRVLLLVCWMLGWTSFLMADEQGNEAPVFEVKGRVVDEDGMALPGASVWVKGTVVGAGTDVDGNFTVKLNSRERCVLRVSFTGYVAEEREVLPGTDSLYHFRLKLSRNPLDEVVVTGTRTPKPLKDVPVLTRVISSADIAQINPMDLQSLLEYEMPGLQFGLAHGSGLPELRYQGAAGGYVLFLLDGERIAGEGSSNNIDYSMIDVDNVERVEIVKGPMSTLYGSQAMGGVVNIITKSASRPFTGNVSARYGTNDGQKYSLSLGTNQGRFSTLTTLSYRKRDAYALNDEEGQISYTHYKDVQGRDSVVADTATRGMTSVKGFEVWQVYEKLSYTFTDNFRVSVNGSYYHNHVQDYIPAKEQDVFSTYTINPKMYYALTDNHVLEWSYLYQNYEKRYTYTTGIPDQKVFGDQTNTARLNYSGVLGEKHMLTAGVEMNTQRLRHYWFGNGTGKVYDAQTYSVYVQEEWKMLDNLTLLAGARGDYHSKYDFHVSPKISLMYKWGIVSWRGGYGMGFRIPSLKELYSEYDMGDNGWFLILGNEDLKPERSHQFTLSGEVTKGIFNASISGYYTRYFDEIALGIASDGENQQYYNAENATKTGADATVQFRFRNGLTLKGAYAYVNAHSEVDGYNQATDRPHSLTFSLNYTRNLGKVSLSAALNGWWMSSVDVWYKNESGGYVQNTYDDRTFCTLNMTGKFPRGIRFTLGVDNLFDFNDKNVTADQSVMPQQGIGLIGTLSLNLSDMFKL